MDDNIEIEKLKEEITNIKNRKDGLIQEIKLLKDMKPISQKIIDDVFGKCNEIEILRYQGLQKENLLTFLEILEDVKKSNNYIVKN